MTEKAYEKPQIRDLDELGVEGLWPLGSLDGGCSDGSGNQGHTCTDGSGTLQRAPCGPGSS